MTPWSLSFEGTETETISIEAALEEKALSCSRFEKKGTKGKIWIFEALFESPSIIENYSEKYPALASFASERFQCVKLPDKDWVAENRASFQPLEIGPFIIHGAHDISPPEKAKIPLEIEASLAFGTGSHATTRGCLELLLDCKGKSCTKILDLGCGTGVLAMAAAHIFPLSQTIHAVDNDPDAVQITQENLLKNGFEKRITTFLSDGFNNPILQQSPYDLIFGNILASPLIALAPEMMHSLSSHGHLILSGLLQSQENDILEAYEKEGGVLVKAAHLDDWSALLLKKNCV